MSTVSQQISEVLASNGFGKDLGFNGTVTRDLVRPGEDTSIRVIDWKDDERITIIAFHFIDPRKGEARGLKSHEAYYGFEQYRVELGYGVPISVIDSTLAAVIAA